MIFYFQHKERCKVGLQKINNTQIRCLLLLFVCFIAQHSHAQNREAAFNTFFSEIDKNGDINGSVAVLENGKTIYQKSFGYADLEHKKINTENTLFQVASVSKLFTAIAVLQLCEQKKLNLSDKFSHYFPDFPYPEVTIQQLLSNTSGVPNTGEVFVPFYRLNHDTVFTLNDVIPVLKKSQLPQNFEAGEAWEYSNTNYVLAALLVEKISGERFDHYLSKNIFIPTGMKNTFQKASGTNPYTRLNVAFNYALPYRYSISPVRVDTFDLNDYKVHYKSLPAEGDANMYTSVTDLANFYKALYNGRLLKSSSRDMLIGPSTKNNGKKIKLIGLGSEIGVIGDFYWGFGNRISLDSSIGKIVWQSGGMPGCRANILYNVDKQQLIIWLNNTESSSSMDNVFGAMALLNGKTTLVKKAKKQVAKIYAQLLETKSEDDAFAKLIEMSSDSVNYVLDENELNELAYEFFNAHKNMLAFETFRAALVLFPGSDNLFNSYGEVLAQSGKKEQAITMYKKSLVLNPNNEDSKKSLLLLEKK